MALKRSVQMRNELLDTESFKTLMDGGLLVIFSGVQPINPSSPISASDKALLKVTVQAQGYSGGVNGLNFAAAATNGYITKDSAIWQGVGLDNGQAGYFRYFSNKDSTAATINQNIDASGNVASYSTVTASKACFEGTCGSTGDLQMVSNSIAKSATSTIDQFKVSLPE